MESEVFNQVIEVVVIIALLAYIGWQDYNHRKEQAKLLNALLAKKPEDMVNMTLADQTTIKPTPPSEALQDVVDTSELSDEEFERFVGVPNGKQ